MDIIFIASASSIHSARWIKYFADKYSRKVLWITAANPTHETIREFRELNMIVDIIRINRLSGLFSLLRILFFRKYSLVHIHYLGWHSLLALFLRKDSSLILTPWGSDVLFNNSLLKRTWLKFLFKKSNLVICDSKRLENQSILLGAKKENIKLVMFGIQTNLYKSSRTIFSQKDKIIIGSNRKLEEVYDVKTLLLAAKIICNKRDDLKFLIAGDGSLFNEYHKFIIDNKLTNKVILLGLLNRDEMINFYNSIDLYVSTSLSDGGLSSSIAEAMSFERIVIITNNSDNQYWVKNREEGFLFENSNYNQLVGIIEKISNNKKDIIQISKLGRKVIEDRYSYNSEMKKVEDMYLRIHKNH
tara:strand:+ start:1146 stop:2219 length:1074 start_codon:yes stop_codon:yes gene_type:complete